MCGEFGSDGITAYARSKDSIVAKGIYILKM